MTQVPMPSSDILANTQIWFSRARPEPTANDISSQFGCHFEEVSEMLVELSSSDPTLSKQLTEAQQACHNLAEYLKGHPGIDLQFNSRINVLDAICDQIVTVTGCGHVLKMDVINGMTEVNRSNWSKFDEQGQPILNPDTHKVLKGPDYSPANLTPYV